MSCKETEEKVALTRVLGIDFSGNHLMWRTGCSTSNVWIAEITFPEGQATLTGLCQVQRLSGSAPPFDRLVADLGTGIYDAAGIDAPFSVPDAYVPHGGHRGLLLHVAGLPMRPGQPFPDGGTFAQSLIQQAAVPYSVSKPFRITEQIWASQGLSVRSTL